MNERFKVDKEDDVNSEKLWKAKHAGNVLDYVDKLEGLNKKVGLSGLGWQKIIKAGLSQELRKQLPFVQGEEPKEDDALIAVVKWMCLSHEQYLAEGQREPGRGQLERLHSQGQGAQARRSL